MAEFNNHQFNSYQFNKEIIHMGEMASGAQLTVPVYRLKSTVDGPKIYRQANMHGAEVKNKMHKGY